MRHEHPALIRITHWLAAIAIAVLVPSGLEIFAAFPSFGDKLPERDFFVPPEPLRLGGWLGGGLQWHLTFAWLFLIAGAAYAAYQIATGNYRQVLFSGGDVRGVWPMIRYYFLRGARPERWLQAGTYNPLQKLAYTTAIGLGAVLAATGLFLYKPVQLSGLLHLLGGVNADRAARAVRGARLAHFVAMAGLLAFIPGHVVMVAIHEWTRQRVPSSSVSEFRAAASSRPAAR